MPLFFHKYKKYIVFIIISLLILFFLFVNNKNKFATDITKEEIEIVHEKEQREESLAETEISDEIQIDIKGAVKDPGVYQMKINQRVFEAIEAAGGFDKTAHRDGINLASKLQDEMLIYVPFIGEEITDIPIVQNGPNDDSLGVRINHATESELETLTGIGPSKAQAIIQYIEENGPIQDANDLLNVSGIGEKTLEKFVDDLIIP